MQEMPKHLNLMPPQTHDVKTTPDVVPLSAAHTAPFVTPVAVTATTLATPAVTPSVVGPPPLQTLTVIQPHQLTWPRVGTADQENPCRGQYLRCRRVFVWQKH